MAMYYVGLDLGTKWVYGTILDEDGKVRKEGKIVCNENAVEMFLHGIPKDCLQVVIEACGIWYPLYDYLVTRCSVVRVANPVVTQWIGKSAIKTDKIDSKKLAMLLKGGNISESYIPCKEAREYRQIVKCRQSLVQFRTGLKNMVHARLRRENIKPSFKVTDIFGNKGITWLRGLNDSEINCYLNIICAANIEINSAKKAIPKDKYEKEIEILKTMPGVSDISASTLMSVIVDIKRFPNADALVAYAGLAVRKYQSGNTERSGGITKQGSAIMRSVLVQDAHAAVKQEGKFREAFNRLRERRPYNVAITAVARKMLYIMWFMLTNCQEFDERK
jgi:transposase